MKFIDKIVGRDPNGPTGKTFRRARKAALYVAEYNQSFGIETSGRSVFITRGSRDTVKHTLQVFEDRYRVRHADGHKSSVEVYDDLWDAVYDFMGGEVPEDEDQGGWA